MQSASSSWVLILVVKRKEVCMIGERVQIERATERGRNY